MGTNRKVKYPHLRRAAREMGYNYSYLYRVLEGEYKGRAGLRSEYWAVSAEITAAKKTETRGGGK